MSDRGGIEWSPAGGTPAAWRARANADQWLALAAAFRNDGARLLALWASDDRACAAYLTDEGLRVAELHVDLGTPEVPSLGDLFPATARMERAAFDLSGIRVQREDARPWLRHASWPSDFHPLRSGAASPEGFAAATDSYAFVRVAGDGVHEIPVGPVHAGIIEPGHFRFSVVGEKVLRLEERLGYVHKGIERRFRDFNALDAHRLAARVSGDSAVAFSWAYCRAVESLAGCEVPARAVWLRGVALELERLANHLGDLGALGNDAGFAFALAQFSRLKEELLRAVAAGFGQRYLMDFVVPGGVAQNVSVEPGRNLVARLATIDTEVRGMRRIYDDHPGLHDRFSGAGRVEPALAAQLGLTGLAGRASGQRFDLRVDHPFAPYDQAKVRLVSDERGDVFARVAVRFEEAFESIRLCCAWLDALPSGPIHEPLQLPPDDACGYGLTEGWRGPVFIALEIGPGGAIRRCHPHDPSWQNWPVLEHAIIGNLVPDFPLINKSFNLSYSGHDL